MGLLMAVNSRFVFSTDEALSDSCLDRVSLLSGGVPVAASVALGADRRTITVTPDVALSTGAAYSLSLDGLCDYAGNALVTTVLSFTTAASGAADTTGPVLQSHRAGQQCHRCCGDEHGHDHLRRGAQPADGLW
ncbi:MAG: Ig-like domain-containing protein [Haliea sp.]|nr:Ig-like domain-containing protein [Haliea sp.]